MFALEDLLILALELFETLPDQKFLVAMRVTFSRDEAQDFQNVEALV